MQHYGHGANRVIDRDQSDNHVRPPDSTPRYAPVIIGWGKGTGKNREKMSTRHNVVLEPEDLTADRAEPLHEKNRQFLQYWLSIRASGHMPLKDDFDPVSIPDLLNCIWLLDYRGPDEILVRLCGTSIDRRFGIEITGRNLLSLIPGDLRSIYGAMFGDICRLPCGYLTSGDILLHGARRTTEAIYLPLARTDGRVDVVAGSTHLLDSSHEVGNLEGRIGEVVDHRHARLVLS